MEVVFPDPISDILAARQAQDDLAAQPTELGREEFLKLLIAQLENQDPMNPATDSEFVAQLATFSSLEQLIGANDNLEALGVGQSNLVNAQVLNLIGKEALVEAGSEIKLTDGSAERLVYTLPDVAQSATLSILDETGKTIRTFDLDAAPGERGIIEWDGTDAEGEAVADGTYTVAVRATDAQGESMAVALFKSLPIDGVNFGAAGITLVSGSEEIAYELIVEIRGS